MFGFWESISSLHKLSFGHWKSNFGPDSSLRCQRVDFRCLWVQLWTMGVFNRPLRVDITPLRHFRPQCPVLGLKKVNYGPLWSDILGSGGEIHSYLALRVGWFRSINLKNNSNDTFAFFDLIKIISCFFTFLHNWQKVRADFQRSCWQIIRHRPLGVNFGACLSRLVNLWES